MYRSLQRINIRFTITFLLCILFSLLISGLRGWVFAPDPFVAILPLASLSRPWLLFVFLAGLSRDVFGSPLPSVTLFIPFAFVLRAFSRTLRILSTWGIFWSVVSLGYIVLLVQGFVQGNLSLGYLALSVPKLSITGLFGILLGYAAGVKEERYRW